MQPETIICVKAPWLSHSLMACETTRVIRKTDCVSAKQQANKRLSGRFFVVPIIKPIKNKMLEFISEFSMQVWIVANRFAGYALLNLLDDPAILALAFC